MLIDIETKHGPRKLRVCDNCKSVCIPSGRFCSGHCARAWNERSNLDLMRDAAIDKLAAAATTEHRSEE